LESKGDILVVSMDLPWTKKGEYFFTFRSAIRPQSSHALLNAAFRVVLEAGKVQEAVIIYGVVGKHAIRASHTEEFWKGKGFDQETLHGTG